MSWPDPGGAPQGRPGKVGVVFQGPSLIPALDVAENVALPLLLAGVPERDAVERAVAALDRLDLGALALRLPEELSGGQAQRVAIARVLAAAPRADPGRRADRATRPGHRRPGRHVLVQAADELGAALVVATHDPGHRRTVAHAMGDATTGGSLRRPRRRQELNGVVGLWLAGPAAPASPPAAGRRRPGWQSRWRCSPARGRFSPARRPP